MYVLHGQSQAHTGWTQAYWDRFFESEAGRRYFFTEPDGPGQTRMYIDTSADGHRIFLLSEAAEESFFSTGTNLY